MDSLTLPPRGTPDRLTALWQSSQRQWLCIMLYIICCAIITIKCRLQRNTRTIAQKYCSLWLCHVGWKAYFILTICPFFTDTIHFPFITVHCWLAWIGKRLLRSGFACPWYQISADYLYDDVFILLDRKRDSFHNRKDTDKTSGIWLFWPEGIAFT